MWSTLAQRSPTCPLCAQARSFDDIKKNFFGTNDNDVRELAFHYVVSRTSKISFTA